MWTLAREAADPAAHPVLDIGAGIGRNALALARRGHPVDVVELTEEFADVIRSDAAAQSVEVRVIMGDVFSMIDELRRDHRLILLSEVVSDFVSTEQLRGLFELAGQCLAPGARLVFNTFLADDEHAHDQSARTYRPVRGRPRVGTPIGSVASTLFPIVRQMSPIEMRWLVYQKTT